MKFIIYCRKSTDTEDKQVLSLESQEKELLQIAKRDNLEIINTYRESRSAKEPGRPIFNTVLSILATGKIDGILCWKIDRLTRNPVDGGHIQWLLQSEKIKCIATFEKNYYPSDNVLLMNIEQAMATQYIRDLSTNVKRGNRAKLERGEWPGKATFGYRNDKASKTVEVDKKAAHYVKRAYDLYATGGYTLKELSDILYTEGLRSSSGNKVFKSKIHTFFTNKFYYGLMERGGSVYVGKHTPIISLELFEKAQDVLLHRKHPRPQKHFYVARGFLRCGSCDCAITGDIKKGFTYYYCTNGKGHCAQHTRYMRSEYIDTLLSTLFLELQFDLDLIELMASAYQEKYTITDDYFESSIKQLSDGLKLLLDKELALVDGLSSNIIRKELYTVKMKEIENQRSECTLQLQELRLKARETSITSEHVKNLFIDCNKASESYLAASDAQKRVMLEEILSNASIENQKIVSYQFKSPFSLIAKSSKNSSFSEMLSNLDSNQDKRYQKPLSYH